ncbi:hypothetical protein Lesp02_65750 [Lentzea sp. NBRC 105346]|uniref:WXG100 family type VII secretion target n=1 Tax=Lentzea sp. NBRC 105346 TaxID=3032205 RepID=UPI0024A46C99|nr:hypothetical protein [Lentzea sp. NBRC 105346]GLZ34388.1 hypothetical protein Lesp02_65750 [Lentzea sp. NBRC 105346]
MSAPATQSKGPDPQKLYNDVQGTVSAVERGDWINAGLGIANTAMDIVGVASNPLSGFLAAGFSWAIEHVDFLREPFDVLLGNPQAIQAMAESFKSAGGQVQTIANDYRNAAVQQTSLWMGQSADNYRNAASKHAGGMDSLSKACNGVAAAVSGAGQLVATVRKMVMDLISQAVADMVMKIIQWLAASIFTFGAAIAGAIADIVSTACKYAKKLADFMSKLAGSLSKLMNLVKKVAEIAKIAEQVIQAISSLAHKAAGGRSGGGGGAGPRASAGGLGITEEQLDRASRGAGTRYAQPVSGGATVPSGVDAPYYNGPGSIHGDPGYTGGGGYQGGGGQVHQPPQVGGQGNYGPGGGYGPGGPGNYGPGGGYGPGGPGNYGPGGGYGPGGPGGGHGPGGGYGPGGPGNYSPGGGHVPGGPGSVNDPGRWEDGHYDKNTGKWIEGHFEKGHGTTGTSGASHGGTPVSRPGDWYRPGPDMAGGVRPAVMPHGAGPDMTTHAAGGGSGHLPAGGHMPGLGGGGGGGAGFGGGGAPGGGGTGPSMTPGGAAGVMPTGMTGGVPDGGGAGGGAAGRGPAGGAAAGGMMGGMGAAGGHGQQGGGSDHKRKVKLEGEKLVDPPKAAKPIIGE